MRAWLVTRCALTRPHYDAKLFPHVHCFGTGSLKSEPGGCAMHKLCRNRAFALESWFRRSTQWAFFQNDNALKNKLFWNNRAKRRHGLSHGASDADRFAQMYGTIVPANIPESTAWWKRQTRELAAITDARGLAFSVRARRCLLCASLLSEDAEAGLMQIMVPSCQVTWLRLNAPYRAPA